MRRRVTRVVSALGGVTAVLASATACTLTLPVPGRGAAGAAVVQAAAQRPADLLETSHTGLRDVSGYEVTGTLEFGGVEAQADLQVGYASGHGTLTEGGTTEVLDLGVVDPTWAGDPSGLFVTAPASYWEQQGFTATDAARYAGQQVSIPRSSPLAGAAALLTARSFADLLFDLVGDAGRASVLATRPVDAQPAWVVDFGTAPDTRLTVQIAGQRFPLRLQSPHASLALQHFGHEPPGSTPGTVTLSLPG